MTVTDFEIILLTIVLIIIVRVLRKLERNIEDIYNKLRKNADWRVRQSSINDGWNYLYSSYDRRLNRIEQHMKQEAEEETWNETDSNDIGRAVSG